MRVARKLLASSADATVVAFGTPAIAALVPEARSVVCCYDTTPASQKAAVGALLGDFAPAGRLPLAGIPPSSDGSKG